mgnify:CR=1 FL=1
MEQKSERCLREIVVSLDDNDNSCIEEENAKFLRKVFASAHINVLLGSGFSGSVVPVLQGRESWFQTVDEHIRDCPGNEREMWLSARALLRAEYFKSIMHPLCEADATELQKAFVASVCRLIENRGTTTLPKRVNFFTTNYDPLIELSLESLGVPFNDGFVGRGKPRFDPSAFSRLMCEQSLFMEYTSQVTTANVLKAHGSLTWRRVGGFDRKEIAYSSVESTLDDCIEGYEGVLDFPAISELTALVKGSCDAVLLQSFKELVSGLSDDDVDLLQAFGKSYDPTLCIVNPAKRKFEETVLEQSYYDLLRIYANELDRNNALLLVFGFSFADEHILELTKRAIRSNPKLIVLISCHTRGDAAWYRSLFPNADNVYLLVPKEDKEIGLGELTEVLRCVAR